MNEPTPIRPRQPRRVGPIIALSVLFALAALGIVESVVLLTLYLTGQIG